MNNTGGISKMTDNKDTVLPQVTATRKQLIEKIERGENLTDEEIAVLKYHNDAEERKQLDRIIPGVNNVFSKHYNLEEYGLEFDIKIKAPNIIENGKIQARREAYLEGMGLAVSNFVFQCYQTLATIRVCGIEVPDVLAKDEDIYNLFILGVIGKDFGEWLNSFRY